MKMQKFLHRNYKKMLTVNALLFVLSLAAIISLNELPGVNQITAFSVGTNIDVESGSGVLSVLNYTVFSIFILNILSVVLLFKVYNPQSFLIGPKIVDYTSNKAIVSDFMRTILKAHSKLTDKEYTVFIMDNLKNNNLNKHPSLKYININHGSGASLNVKIGQEINALDSSKLSVLFQLIIDELSDSKSGSDQDSFKTVLKYNMDPKLLSTLNSMGVFI